MRNQTTKKLAGVFFSAAVAAACFASFVAPAPSFAKETNTSVKNFVHMAPSDQATIIGDTALRIANDVKASDPVPAQKIYDYFFTRDSKGFFVGVIDLNHELIRQAHLLKDHKKSLSDIKDVEYYIQKEIEQHVGITLTKQNGVFVATSGAPADDDATVVSTAATQPTTKPSTKQP